MVLASCGINPSSDSISDTVENNEAAIESVKRIDSYYLVPCKLPNNQTSDALSDILDAIDKLMEDYADCYKRHNTLIEQVK